MTQKQVKPKLVALGLACLLVSAGIFAVTGTVSAAHEAGNDGFVNSVIDSAESNPLLSFSGMQAAGSGTYDRVMNRIAAIGDDTNATDAANAFSSEVNNNSAAYESWAADNAPVSSNHTAMEVTFQVGEDTATRYVTADVVTDGDGHEQYENVSVVESLPDGETADESVTLEGAAARNAADELAAIRESHISQGEPLSRDDPVVVHLFTEYSGKFDTSIADGEL